MFASAKPTFATRAHRWVLAAATCATAAQPTTGCAAADTATLAASARTAYAFSATTHAATTVSTASLTAPPLIANASIAATRIATAAFAIPVSAIARVSFHLCGCGAMPVLGDSVCAAMRMYCSRSGDR